MARSLFITLIGAASLGAALIVGCSDKDAKPASSQAGDSCVRTADCADGLSCIANVCYAMGHVSNPSGGEAGAPVGPALPSLGGEGESCSSRLDCEAGLGCFNQRCTTPPVAMTGEGGASGTGIELGERGETCRVNGDCKAELACIPSSVTAGIGVCDLKKYGIAPTGKQCTGECSAPADCCQLPLGSQTAIIKSCKDIDDAITTGAVSCAAPTPGTQALLCFQQATYCSGCSAKTWDCTNNTCVYKPACVVAAGADVPTGCPSLARINVLIGVGGANLTCNADSKTCVGATVSAACTNDASCATKPVVDRTALSTDVCSAGECTCYQPNHECYRKCARDIECAVGSSCDAKSHVCLSTGACSDDTQCAVKFNSLDYKCDANTCKKTCASDHDCSPSGHNASTFNGSVCAASGFCADVTRDCVDDSQCGTLGALKTFCVGGATGTSVTPSSAISD